MNLVLDEAEEVSMKRKTRKPVGACQGTHGRHVRIFICLRARQTKLLSHVHFFPAADSGRLDLE